MAYLGMANPDVYKRAIRSPVDMWYTANATYDGVAVTEDLRPTGGGITDTTKPGVRRMLSADFAGGRDLFGTLGPLGTQLAVSAQVRLSNREVVTVPMGVFDIDVEKLSESSGLVSVTAPDRWANIQRARFVRPQASSPGTPVVAQIATLIRGALGAAEPVNVLYSPTTTVGALTWEKDRDKAIQDLAASIGAWVYADRSGVFTIAALPDLNRSADWLVDASASGVLTELDRERSRARTRNVVVVESSAADNVGKFNAQVVWDSDPASPTYAGTDPINDPASAGPFGIATHYFDTPLPLSDAQAQATAYTILGQQTGLSSQVSLGQVPNPAVDAGDALDVLPPSPGRTVVVGYREGVPLVNRVSAGAVLERHLADTVMHPLSVGPAQTIEGRSTRTDDVA